MDLKWLKTVYDLFEKIRRERWFFWDGLLCSLILATLLYQGLYNVLQPSLLKFHHIHSILPQLHLFGLAAVLLAVTFFWYCARRIPKFGNNDRVVLFAPYGHVNVKTKIEEIRERLKIELTSHDIESIRLVSLRPHLLVDNQDKAHEMRRKTSCFLIIWGLFVKNQHKKRKEMLGFPRIFFTYKYPKVYEPQKEQLKQTIQDGIVNRKWTIRKEEEHSDSTEVVRNIDESALYIIGIISFLAEDYDNAIKIFEKLLTQPERKRVRDLARLVFFQNVERRLRETYLESAKAVYKKQIFLPDRFNLDTGLLNQGLARAQEARRRKENWPQAHLTIAIFFFLLNDVDEARKHIKMAKEYSKEIAAAWLSDAFLDLYEEKYKEAVGQYEEAFKKEAPSQLLLEIILFISNYFDKHRNEVQFRYAIGFLNYIIGNHPLALQELNEFVKESENKPQLEPLRDEAVKYISLIVNADHEDVAPIVPMPV